MNEFDENDAVKAIRTQVAGMSNGTALALIDAIFDYYELHDLLDVDFDEEIDEEACDDDAEAIANFIEAEYDDFEDFSHQDLVNAINAEIEYENNLLS